MPFLDPQSKQSKRKAKTMTKKENLRQEILRRLDGKTPREGMDGVTVKDIQNLLLETTKVKYLEAMIIAVLKEITSANDGEGYETIDGTFIIGDEHGGQTRMAGLHKYWFFFT